MKRVYWDKRVVARGTRAKNILMGDRVIVEGRWCGNPIHLCPSEYLQELVDKLLGTAAERDFIRSYLRG